MSVQDGFGITVSGATTGAIGYLTGVVPPGLSRAKIDTTTHSAVAGRKTSQPSKITEIPDVALSLNFDKAQQAVLYAAVDASPEVWTFTDPGGSTYVATGYILSVENDSVVIDDIIKQTVNMAFTGAMVFTA